ncbi:MAG: heme-binding beta-barrel domain-containing protein [Mariprofundus sp.]|nr:heme-binding beta-barrel domain-containing protein [Mariprofundus sp.]
MSEINYGPLTQLIGVWKGDKGKDIAPEPDGSEEDNAYFETITVEPIGDVSNADAQTLAVLHYCQIVQRKQTGVVFHHQTGYWSWDAATGVVTHSFSIPRGVTVVACGKAKVEADSTVIEVDTTENPDSGGIAQSPFMQKSAKTTSFSQTLSIQGDLLRYQQMMVLDIYGKIFNHSDVNELKKCL